MILLGVALAALLVAPWLVNDYLLTVLIVIFYFAYTGQAWNIMMGFAGQLSLGHAIYAGLGAYVAAVLFTRYGIGPWIGFLAAIPVVCSVRRDHWLSGVSLRRRRRLFRHPHHRVCRVRAHRLRSSGLRQRICRPVPAGRAICPQRSVAAARQPDDVLLRDPGRDGRWQLVLSRFLLRSRIGYFWLAIREDEQAARAAGIDTFRYKMYAVMISAAVTSFAGVFYAFFYNNLFPEQVFNISRSIEMILGPVIGGVGTLFGPILGAFVLTGLAESVNSAMSAFGLDLPGAKQIFYGICLLLVVVALPEGVWPWLARRLGIAERGR